MKHEGRWTHRISTNPQHPPGTIIMTSPTGHAYLSYPHVYNGPPPKYPPEQENPKPSALGGASPPDDDPGEPPF